MTASTVPGHIGHAASVERVPTAASNGQVLVSTLAVFATGHPVALVHADRAKPIIFNGLYNTNDTCDARRHGGDRFWGGSRSTPTTAAAVSSADPATGDDRGRRGNGGDFPVEVVKKVNDFSWIFIEVRVVRVIRVIRRRHGGGGLVGRDLSEM